MLVIYFWEFDLDVHPQTLERTMRDNCNLGGVYAAATAEELPRRTKDDRWAWADTMLFERADPED